MDFAQWLHQELDERQWLPADLVRSARLRGYKITPTQVSRILSREQEAGISAVIAIAHGLNLPREEVFRARGWLLSEATQIITSDTDPRVAQLAMEVAALPPHIRHAVLSAVAALLEAVRAASPPIGEPPLVSDAVEEDGPAGETLELDAGNWITVSEAAEQSGLAVRTIQRWLQDGKLPSRRHGRIWYTRLDSVLAYREAVKKGRPKKVAPGS